MDRHVAVSSLSYEMECRAEETKQIVENLRRTVHLLSEYPHLQGERISGALDLMNKDVKHQIAIARLSRISRKARRKAGTLHKGLYMTKEEARATIEEIMEKGSHTPLEVAIELRKKGYEGHWMRPRFVRRMVKHILRKKQKRARLHSKLRNAGKGLPDRFGRPVKSRGEVMCEMLPDFCRDIPTVGMDDCECEFDDVMKRMEEVAWWQQY
ncbi:hypothetical protein FGB62_334g08 [Gracilaria domingensis]|nr:hypothetical protein FGB62_334g08 [Gracilaria domingensis]